MKRLRQYGQLVIMGVSTLVLGACATLLNPLAASAAPTDCTSFNVGDASEKELTMTGNYAGSEGWMSYRNTLSPSDALTTVSSSHCSDINVAYIYNGRNKYNGQAAPSQC